MYINGNKHPILWFIVYGIPIILFTIIFSIIPRKVRMYIYKKYYNK